MQPAVLVAQIVVISLGGIVGALGVTLSMSRLGAEMQEHHRDKARFLAERDNDRRATFAALVPLLADESKPMSRIAAIYGLGSLADSWATDSNHREASTIAGLIAQCIRNYNPPNNPLERHQDHLVQMAAIKTLKDHLSPNAKSSWSDYEILLRGSYFDYDVDLSGIKITGCGHLDLSDVRVTRGVSIDLSRTTLTEEGRLSLGRARLEGGAQLLLTSTKLEDSSSLAGHSIRSVGDSLVDLSAVDLSRAARLTLSKAIFENESCLSLHGSKSYGTAVIDLSGIQFSGSSTGKLTKLFLRGCSKLQIHDTQLSDDARLNIQASKVYEDARVNFSGFKLKGNAVFQMNNNMDQGTNPMIIDPEVRRAAIYSKHRLG